jgi:hypothetical protein
MQTTDEKRTVKFPDGRKEAMTYAQAKRAVLQNRQGLREKELKQFTQYQYEKTCVVCKRHKVTAVERAVQYYCQFHQEIICFECANIPACHAHGRGVKRRVTNIDEKERVCAFCEEIRMTCFYQFNCGEFKENCKSFLCRNCANEPTFNGNTLTEDSKAVPEGWTCQLRKF